MALASFPQDGVFRQFDGPPLIIFGDREVGAMYHGGVELIDLIETESGGAAENFPDSSGVLSELRVEEADGFSYEDVNDDISVVTHGNNRTKFWERHPRTRYTRRNNRRFGRS